MIKDFIKKILSEKQANGLRNLRNGLKSKWAGNNLTELAKVFETDKWGTHFYTPHYQTHLEKFRLQKINLLEIGVGGYDNPRAGGNSLRMWKAYFPNGNIFSIDVYDKSTLQENRIKIFKGSQVDFGFLEKVTQDIGELDIIIDDGSHVNEHVIETFKFLFPKLKDGGIYVIEDTQTSYWEEFGGDSTNLNNPKMMTNFFKNLTDGLNHKEFLNEAYQISYYDRKITSIHFYHNLIFVYKGNNDEESNMVRFFKLVNY